jgi:hypothetical protein
MPLRRNPQVPRLLSWHGHDSGGVHVPFQGNANPLGQVISTRLMLRLRQLSKSIAAGKECPRWIFLIGGPGNGKSETVPGLLDTSAIKVQLLRPPHNMLYVDGQSVVANPLVNRQASSYTHS